MLIWGGGILRVVGKGDKERIIPLNDQANEAISLVKRAGGVGDAIFGKDDGLHLNTNSLDVLIKRWIKKHKLPDLGLHRLRHTFATRLLARGVDIYDIRDLLGHESVKTTEIYLSANPERLRGAVERV